MKDIRKVIIIGAGPAGLSAALQLKAARGISCVLYEIRSRPNTLGGAIGIPANGLRLLHRLGLYEKMLAKGAETQSLVVHSFNGTTPGQADITSWSKKQTGFGYVRIKRSDVMDVLLDAVKEAEMPVFYGKNLIDIKENDKNITATFSDGTQDTSDLLIGCDGIHSSVRKLHVDPECMPEYSGISNMVPPGRTWHKGRCLIIGDAAHAMPPHASRGFLMALEDVFLLSKLLQSDVGSIDDGLRSATPHLRCGGGGVLGDVVHTNSAVGNVCLYMY